jgi:predicted outer membrane lipoprotein
MVTVLGILAACAFGFVVGRIWQIRCDELERRAGFALPPVARIPQPTNAET